MRLIESEDPQKTEQSTEAEPREAARNTNGASSRLPLYAALVLVAAGLIVGLVFLARWIYHETQNKTGGNHPSTSQSASNNSDKAGSNSSHSGSSSNPAANSQTGSQSLPNNGPGNVIGVFVAASFAAGALHYIVSLRRQARN